MGICISLTAKPIKPIIKKPTATALEISRNSQHQRSLSLTLPIRKQMGKAIPRLFGFVHLFKKNMPSLTKSRGISRISLTWSDMVVFWILRRRNLNTPSVWIRRSNSKCDRHRDAIGLLGQNNYSLHLSMNAFMPFGTQHEPEEF